MNPVDHRTSGVMLYVPVHLIEQFQGHRLALRSDAPLSFPHYLNRDGMEGIEYLQLTDLDVDPSPLMKWESVFPIDLVMTAPGSEFPRLYAFAPLLERGPVRVSIPAADGMEKAVKLAASLRFSVKIIPGQPAGDQVMQLIRLAEFYLRNPTIEEPIEFFHSLFFAMVNDAAANLWEILEKDPTRYCFVTNEGGIDEKGPCPIPNSEMGPETVAGTKFDTVKARYSQRQMVKNRFKACSRCIYCRWCRGFFKYPAPDYSCAAVFPLFQHLLAAATEFKQDLSASISGAPP